ncbi:outer membrane beta-barrel protein [Flavicella marina]|uniref:outer membrane beta-barrel protein n=1 Tax=Flavicella marina TaxID=1475951 RepID=UPI001264B9F3|nr:outer membrane beta-barrel protein [Flavicella marina]
MPINLQKNIQLIFVFLCTISTLTITAQDTPSITGKIVTPENEPLEYASVVLLHPTDSTMINYTTTDQDGLFKLVEDARDSMLLQVHSTGFKSFFKTIVYKNQAIDLSSIILEEDIGVLDEVTISAVVPIQIKKDTVAFNTSAFKINHDDNIEEMLEKLPGMEIDSDGKMIAQGNEVTKIYVDGKEFFGGDPSVVMKNLSADVIAKVEVIDKKSDESELTGVSDGNKQVILNFTLKKDKKNRGFGKASAGIGLDNRYFANANYNRFSSKTQFSAVAKTNNINVTGSNIRDFLQNANGLGDQDENEESDIPKKKLSGFLNTQIAGLHFGHEFKKRESLNADYTYNYSDNDGTSYTKRTSFQNSGSFNSDYVSQFDNQNKDHKLNFNYLNQSHKTYSFFAKGGYSINDRNTLLNRFTNYYNEQDTLRATNDSRFNNKFNKQNGNVKLNFYKKLNDKGKNFSVGTYATTEKLKRYNQQYTLNKRNIDTDNTTTFETDIFRDEIIDNNYLNYNAKYTEPLGNDHYIKIEAVNSYRKIDEDIYQSKTFIDNSREAEILAYQYKHQEFNYQSRAGYSYNIEKLNIYAGAEYQNISREFGETNMNPNRKTNSFINPIAKLQYIPKRGRKYRINYKKIVKNPTTFQSSTVINDLNPFFIRKGNPNLNPEQRDDLLLRVNVYDQNAGLTFYGNVRYQHTDDAIVQTVEIDDNFIRTRSFENIGTKDNITTAFSLSKKVNGLGIRYTIKNRNSFAVSNTLVNLELNDVSAKKYSGYLKFENNNKKIYDLKLGGEYTLNQTNFSIVRDLNRQFVTQHYFTMLDYDITSKFTFNTQFDYFIYTDSKFSPDRTLPLWNAAISYSLTKKKNNVFKLLLIDMLNKNVDIHRRSNVNYYEEITTESLGMYAVISYTYRLNNGSKKKKNKRS